MNYSETVSERNSLSTMEYYTPSSCQISGIAWMQMTGKISERTNEMAADTAPSLSAVKNEDV